MLIYLQLIETNKLLKTRKNKSKFLYWSGLFDNKYSL